MRKTSSSPRQRQAALAGRKGQRGVAAIFAGIALLALVVSVLLSINVGRLYYSQRDLQRQATLAALAGATQASGCGNGGVPDTNTGSGSVLWNKVQATILANNGTAASMTGINGFKAVEVGAVNETSGKSVTDDAGNVYPIPQDGLRHFIALAAGDSHINAVRVNLSSTQPLPIGINFFGSSQRAIYATAVAKQQAIAGIGLGTSLAELNAGALNSLLGALLHTNVNLNLVSYQGLAQAQVSLANLMVAAHVTDLNSLVNLQTDLPGALQIVGTALTAAGGTVSGTAGGLVSGLGGQSYTGSTPTQNYFGQIFNNLGGDLNPGVNDALSLAPFIDGVNLLEALGEAANKGSSIALPATANVAGIAGIGLFLKILNPEQFAVGPAGYNGLGQPLTVAKSSQVTVQARVAVNLVVATINLAVDIQAANGQAILTNVSCPSAANATASATVQTTTSLLTTYVGAFTGSPTATPVQNPTSGSLVNLAPLGIPLLSINVTTAAQGQGSSTPGTTVSQTGSGPFPQSFPDIGSTTALSTLVSSALSSNLSIKVGGLLNLSVGAVLAEILTPITTLLDSVISPLLQTLGLSLGVSSVTLESIPTANIQPVLVNTAIAGTPQS